MLSSFDTAPLRHLAVIVGSNRQDSINRKLAQALVRLGAGKFDATFEAICRRKWCASRPNWRALTGS